jgi:hypothetical protein
LRIYHDEPDPGAPHRNGIACWWGPDDGPVLLAETDVRVGGRFRVRFRMLDGSEFAVGDLMMISVVGATPFRRARRFAASCRLCLAWGSRPAHVKAMADHMATFDAPTTRN